MRQYERGWHVLSPFLMGMSGTRLEAEFNEVGVQSPR